MVAAHQGISLSALMQAALETHLRGTRGYYVAMAEELELLERGQELGPYGQASWTRDDLHERNPLGS